MFIELNDVSKLFRNLDILKMISVEILKYFGFGFKI